ncbi:MAG: tetratricopeptide repeat protein [Phormidesmis sp.]
MTLEPGQPNAPTPDPIASALDRLSNAEKTAQAKAALLQGQATFERGRYRRAIESFKAALALSNPMGARGGEIQMWLVNAYVAAGDNEAGLALCRKLILHPDLETKRQSKRLLYILEAPELEMRPEWVTKIPDLAELEDGKGKSYVQKPKSPRRRKPKPEPEPIDLSLVDTADNQFVWIALIGVALTLAGLAWLA